MGPGTGRARPRLIHSRLTQPAVVALLLHGGSEESTAPVRASGPAAWVLVPLARRLERWSRGRVASYRLINAVRGWNEPVRSPVADAQWALTRVRQAHPGVPVVVIGHSMGGRTALQVVADRDTPAPGRSAPTDGPDTAPAPVDAPVTGAASVYPLPDDPAADVVGVVALAPWLADAFTGRSLARAPLYVVHGRQDTVTDPDASRALVREVVAAGGRATWQGVVGWHSLQWRASRWQRPVVEFVERVALAAAGDDPVEP